MQNGYSELRQRCDHCSNEIVIFLNSVGANITQYECSLCHKVFAVPRELDPKVAPRVIHSEYTGAQIVMVDDQLVRLEPEGGEG